MADFQDTLQKMREMGKEAGEKVAQPRPEPGPGVYTQQVPLHVPRGEPAGFRGPIPEHLSLAPMEMAREFPGAREAAKETGKGMGRSGVHGMGKVLSRIGPWAAGAAVLGAGAAVGEAGERIHEALSYKRDYENMLEFAPQLKEHDPEQVKARFDTLRRFNPKMSKDPLVASSWVEQTIQFPTVTPAILKDVAEKGKPSRYAEAFRKVPPLRLED